RLERDAAAEVLDIATHDIHADASAGKVGDRVGSREPRQEDEIADLILSQGDILINQIFLFGLPQHALGVDASAIVLDLDDDASSALSCRQVAGALFALARGKAVLRRLKAMIS